MSSHLTVGIARALFVAASCLLGISIALGLGIAAWKGAIAGTFFGLSIVGIDSLLKNFTIRAFSSATFGLLVGILCAWLLLRVDLFNNPWLRSKFPAAPSEQITFEDVLEVLELTLYMALGFLGMSVALRSTREEFSFVIPYVRFRQEGIQGQPLIVDTNIIIDGRIPAIVGTGFLSGTLIIPRFVLDELHILADSPDAIKQERGKRGLQCLEDMEKTPGLDVTIHEDYQPLEKLVDTKLVQLAKLLSARLLTNDSNLGKVAELQGISVLNLNALARAMRPTITPGDEIELTLVKEGKDAHQAVGYLPDGTMIVVNQAIEHLGSTVPVVVGGALQTTAGAAHFCRAGGFRRRRSRQGLAPGAFIFHWNPSNDGIAGSLTSPEAEGASGSSSLIPVAFQSPPSSS